MKATLVLYHWFIANQARGFEVFQWGALHGICDFLILISKGRLGYEKVGNSQVFFKEQS